MQTTLLGLAIAIILALVAALVGPLVIDWGSHRSVFEAQASRLICVDMRVTGAIDARLLPSPRLVMHDIEIGKGNDRVGARSLAIEFALGPLLRGEWRAAELHLAGGKLRLGLDASGHLQAPDIPINFSPDVLSIERLSIEDASVTLTDTANGGQIMLDRLSFNGDARSLVGPFNGAGAARVDGELYPFRVSTGRANDDGAIKLHVNIDPLNRPLSIEADGTLALTAGEPSFDGTLSVARSVGIASARAASVTQPWRLSGKIKASAASALMPQLEFQYGSQDQVIKLTGTADFKFGRHPRFDGVLSGRQIDLDRALAADAGLLRPVAAMHRLAGLATAAFHPTIPVQIGIGIDRMTLGGNSIESLRGDVSADANGWNLDRIEFRAPGFTRVRLSGELAGTADGVAFTGPAEMDSGDPKALAAWIEGRAAPEQGQLRPLRLRGDITMSGEKIAIERLNAEFERQPVIGRLSYAFADAGRAARLEAELAATELDVDAALDFGKALVAGSNLQRPQHMIINADIGRANFAGIDARNASARVTIDGSGWQIDRLSVSDLGGNSFSANGHIDSGGRVPRGSLVLDADVKRAGAVAALIDRFYPGSAATSELRRIRQAKLHATLDVADDKDAAAARLALTGDIDTMHVDGVAHARGDWKSPGAAEVRIDGTIGASESAALFNLIGLDRIITAGKGPGRLTLQIAAPAGSDLTGSVQVSGDGFDAKSRITIAGRGIAFDGIDARLGESAIRGHLAVADSPRRVDGAFEADTLDVTGLIAGLVGVPSAAANKDGSWPSAPFAGGAIGDINGEIALKALRANVTPRLPLRQFETTLRFARDAVTFERMAGEIAGGRFSGQLTFRSTDAGLNVRGAFALDGADAANLLPVTPPAVRGSLDITADVEGSGFSAAALIGSLRGSGSVALTNGHLAGLDPGVFDIASRAVDDGLKPDAAHISGVVGKALDGGAFAVTRVKSDFAVSVGQARVNNVRIRDDKSELTLGGSFDLTDGSLDGRLVLSGPTQGNGLRPDIFVALSGSLMAPKRTVDVSALTGRLALRAVDNQSRRLRTIESTAQSVAPAVTPPPKIKEAPALPAPLEIRPLPVPRSAPEASVGPKH